MPDKLNPEVLYAGTEVGLYAKVTTDAVWEPVIGGPGSVPVMDLFWYDPQSLGVATHGRGLYLLTSLAAPAFISQSDCLFSWAERAFPQFFAPARSASAMLTGTPYYYRYYSGTGNYLATNSADSHVYALGVSTGGNLLNLGPMTTFLSEAGCSQQ